jgi:hypothetical protein
MADITGAAQFPMSAKFGALMTESGFALLPGFMEDYADEN